MKDINIKYDGQDYIPKYNEQSKYYEVEITAEETGIKKVIATYTDILGQTYEESIDIQVFAREEIKIESNKTFMWIFNGYDFSVKDIVEIADYEINIDEETNANTIIDVLKENTAKAEDIVAIKKNNEIIYWGIIDKIQNEDGQKAYEYTLKYITNLFDEKVELQWENGVDVQSWIRTKGIEDFLQKTIQDHFITNEDTYINKTFIEVRIATHTKLEISVTNVENDIYNCHTWMTNCTQNYDIMYKFSIENKKLILTIEKENRDKVLIDTQAQNISNYTEVFETNVISKVIVKTANEGRYVLYLKTDRTTTRDMNDKDRAKGRTERVYTEKMEDAKQTAEDTLKQNTYKHMISFDVYKKMIGIGTPIAIKTAKSVILDTYISAIKITQNNFIEYICGNMRIKFIDKLMKERKV